MLFPALALSVLLGVLPPGGTFTDDDFSPHEGSIEAIYAEGITSGCNPPFNDKFCPTQTVTRGALAAFLSRALNLPSTGQNFFSDDNGHLFEPAINKLAAAGITTGCNPPANTDFCPDQKVSRGAMAAFLSRAFKLPASNVNAFVDDNGHLFEAAIQKIAAAGITKGCNPPTNNRYCPDTLVTREQMATFLARGLGLDPIQPPPPIPHNPPGETHLVISQDTVYNGPLVLRGGDTITFQNGAELKFGSGGYADWQGTPTSTWSNNGNTQNLHRDIEIKGSGSIRFMHGSERSVIRFVEIDLRPKREVGHYPLHWHHVGNGSRGTLVEGVVVKNSTNHAFVPHASHGITFRDTIARNIEREAYWWDPGSQSNNIVYDHALADGVHFPKGVDDPLYHRIGAFFLGQGTANVVRDSVAKNTDAGGECSGFHWPEFDHGVWGFFDNAAYEPECFGIFTWQNDSLPHVINGFISNAGVSHGAYVNDYVYNDLYVSSLTLHALGRDKNIIFDGGDLGHVTTVRHALQGLPVIFRNLNMDSFTVDNGAGEPGTYLLENTNLSCGSIQYDSVASGTVVRVNGSTC